MCNALFTLHLVDDQDAIAEEKNEINYMITKLNEGKSPINTNKIEYHMVKTLEIK